MEDTQIENCPNMNIGGLDTDDQLTINSEAPFSPFPPSLAMYMHHFPCLNLLLPIYSRGVFMIKQCFI